jgi:hypothetical protein
MYKPWIDMFIKTQPPYHSSTLLRLHITFEVVLLVLMDNDTAKIMLKVRSLPPLCIFFLPVEFLLYLAI